MTPTHPLTSEDAELLARFHRQGFTRAEWTHEMHVRMGWIHLRRWSFDDALNRMRDGIRALNESSGVVNDDSGGYHETITRAWLTLIATAASNASDSAVFLRETPEMRDKGLLLRHYSEDVLKRREARLKWMQPDVVPLPR